MVKELGAQVCGYSLPPNTTPSICQAVQTEEGILHITGDISDKENLKSAFQHFQPEIVFHLAAQPLVRLSYKEPLLTYQTNVIGTLNMLEAARHTPSVKAFVLVSSDKCYENAETTYHYPESDALGGYDMYSSSKACAEILAASYRRSFLLDGGYALASVRAGNAIGGGDWAEGRLVTDCVRAIESGTDILLRHPQFIRPWQYVLDALGGYLLLGHYLYAKGQKYAQSFNIGPDTSPITAAELARQLVRAYGKGNIQFSSSDALHEAQLLLLDNTKAKSMLGWAPAYNLEKTIGSAVQWDKHFYQRLPMRQFTIQQIHEYQKEMNYRGK